MTRPRRPKGQEKVTIATVAEKAGVSVATVSRVMNGVTSVDPTLAERVQKVAADLGYRPSIVAQGLARGSLRTVGVVVPNLANPYFYQVLKAIESGARANNFRMLTADSDEDPLEEYAICEWLATQVDCLILCSPRMPANRLDNVRRLIPNVVMTNRYEEGLPISAVIADSVGAVNELAEHLRGMGHQSAVYLAGPSRSWAMRERRAALEKTDLEITSIPCGGTIEDGNRILPEALDLDPTAVICFNDLVAFGALARLQELGVSVPGDVSLVGFDDIPFSQYARPSLTSIRSPLLHVGTRSWELVQRIMSGDADQTLIRIPSSLIMRESVGPASAGRGREVQLPTAPRVNPPSTGITAPVT